jgi:hypothetical protein
MSCRGLSNRVRSAECGRDGHSDGELEPPQGLAGLHHGQQTPGLDLLVEGLLKALEAFGVLGDRPDGFLENNRLRGGGTDHSGEPPQMGRAPGGLARLPDILPQQEGFETKLGGLEVPQGIFTGAGALANRFVLDRGDIDRGEIP